MPPRLRRVRDLAVYEHHGTAPDAITQPAVVLIHGAMDRGAGMLRVARRLRHLDLIRYDRRGYGRSREAGPPKRFQDHVQDLDEVMGTRRCILLGHSYGGVIAMALASTADRRVAGVVSYEAPRAWESWWTQPPATDVEPGRAAESFLRHMIGDELWESLPDRTRDERRAEGVTMIAELNFQTTQRFDARRIDVPLVIGVGQLSSDRVQRAAMLTSSEAEFGALVTIEGADHGAHSSHPTEMAALVDLVSE
jgi:pimeloyl-ACP methyl ester carboxylesterase